MVIVVVIALLSSALAICFAPPDGDLAGRLPLAFAAGAVWSELVFFAYYYVHYGRRDPKLVVGVDLSMIEAFVIAGLGALAVGVALWLKRLAKQR